MIVSRTPYRVSFLGGGTDYPAWYRRHGGAVLATTINKFCYLTVRYLPPFFEHRFRVVYSKIENCQRPEEIQHPAVREALMLHQVRRGLEIHHDGDLPARSGMGSSSAFTVGLLHALHALRGRMVSKAELARESIFLEQELLQETVGSQDQVLAAHGGLNHVRFAENGDISVRPVIATPRRVAELNEHLMLFYTGIRRTASQIAGSYVPQLSSRARQLGKLARLVDDGLAMLGGSGDVADFGQLLHEAWVAKSEVGRHITNTAVDQIYEDALAAGALGGKLLGAGGGGFMLLFVRPRDQQAVRRRLREFVHVPFQFESSGSQVIFYDPQVEDAPEAESSGQRFGVFRELSEIAA